MKNLFIIGSGASGMMAAISASIQAEASGIPVKITILENETQVGRKILVTGNGKCNLSNRDMSLQNYHCTDVSFVDAVFQRFNLSQTIAFFESLGLLIKDKNGYLYPNSGQASTVNDLLLNELNRRNIILHCNTHVVNVLKENDYFKVMTSSFYAYEADAVILACGSPAGGVSGSDASGYSISCQLGHTVIPVLPSLVQLRSLDRSFARLAGIRINGTVRLFANGREYASEYGEIQMTEYGISGIPVFQLSGTCAELLSRDKTVEVYIDFMSGETEEDLFLYFCERRKNLGYKKLSAFLFGMFPDVLCQEIIKRSKLMKSADISEMEDDDILRMVHEVKNFKVEIYATNPLKHAQVARGGVSVSEVDPGSMNSRIVDGLFFAGEMLDVDGRCGGYNLQWAWSSGYVAGAGAIGYLLRNSLKEEIEVS